MLAFHAGQCKFCQLGGSKTNLRGQESVESLQITANDEIAAEDRSATTYLFIPLRFSRRIRGTLRR